MNYRRLLILFTVIFVFVLTACSNESETQVDEEVEPSQEQVDTQQEEQQQTEEQVVYPYSYPLTGIPTENEPTQRPIAVTINNHPQARPHSGISTADIVYELLVEADATRYLAIYQSSIPEKIGPVRSARDYFIDIAIGYDALYIAHGYSPTAHIRLNQGVVTHINGMQYDGIYFDRSKDRKAPHNSYITAENLGRAADKLNISLQNKKNFDLAFYASDDNVKMGSEAYNVEVVYTSLNNSYTSIYTYDQESKTYLKASPHQATFDELVDEQVAVSNVLFFETEHQVVDSEGRRVINLTDGGKAYIFQQGQMREVGWKNKNGLLVAVEADGSLVPLVQGKTWVQFVPRSPGLEKSVTYSK